MRRDDIDLAGVTILNSPDIHTWPATVQITKLDLTPEGVHVEFTHQSDPDWWPDVPFGEGNVQYTLWIALNIASSWWAAGCIEFWRGLPKNGGPVDQYAANWYYDPIRWTPMTGHQPAVGELVGFLLTSGDARHGDSGVGKHERSNIVALNFPPAAGQSFTWPVDSAPPVPVPPPVPPPPPPPEPPPVPPPVPPGPVDLVARVAELELIARDHERRLTELEALRATVVRFLHSIGFNAEPGAG